MKVIGSIGLGAMGGAYAKFLLEDNYKVYGIDPDEKNADAFNSFGGELLSNISDLVNKSEVIILSLPKVTKAKYSNGRCSSKWNRGSSKRKRHCCYV